MSRGPRPHRALAEAIPIAKSRGIIQMALSGPERVFDIAIISKVPVTFARVMFAPAILAGIPELADYFKNEITQLRLIARDAAITTELWIRSRHGTWRFFVVTRAGMVEIDREGKRLVSEQRVCTRQGLLSERRDYPTPENTSYLPGTPEPQKSPVITFFPLHPVFLRS